MATNEDKDKEKEQTQGQTQDQGQTQETTPDPVEEAKKQAQAILDAAKAEAEKIVEDGKTEAQKAIDAAKAELEAQKDTTPAPDPEEKVPVRLFKDNGRYKDDVMVAVNGRAFQIKRGETVMVPRYVAEVLERSMAQDQETANLISSQSSEYEREAAKRGLL